jgi:hypothetical protein
MQERYLSLAPLYYRGAHAAAVVYDTTSPESFEKAKYWIGELQKNESSRPGTPTLTHRPTVVWQWHALTEMTLHMSPHLNIWSHIAGVWACH